MSTELGWDGVDWFDLAQDMHYWKDLLNAVINLLVP
jgi:hypothetical protein